MHALARPMAHVRVLLASAVVAATALIMLLAAPFSQSAKADGTGVAGTFSFTGSLLIGCPPGALLCTTGHISGGVNGSFTLTLLTTAPATDPGVLFFTGRLAVHTSSGNLNCTLDGAENAKAHSDGAFGEICMITGGTGTYANAKGDLRMIGTSTQNLLVPSGAGIYQGNITTS